MHKNYENVKNNNSRIDNNMYIISAPTSEINKNNEPLYDNLKANTLYEQNRLLRKLFRNARKPEAIYENLCHGCGYGVFESKSNLCNFCSCVVKGLKNNRLQEDTESSRQMYGNDENIYENICFKCNDLYNTEECQCCVEQENVVEKEASEGTLAEKPNETTERTPIKIKKSKSLHKFDRHNLINGLFGSLKRGMMTRKLVANRRDEASSRKERTLDIIHHVDGYENIFRTNETFDLQRICELKQAELLKLKVSTSEQHIYGRLKLNETLESNTNTEDGTSSHGYMSKSHEQLQVTNLDSLTIKATNWSASTPAVQQSLTCARKRPRVSRPSLLRFRTKYTTNHTNEKPNNATLALPLSDSVCYWLKLLRKQVYNYHSYGATFDNEEYDFCIPKSIPAKNNLINIYYSTSIELITCNFKALPTNFDETMTNIPDADKKGDFEIPKHTNTNNTQATYNSEFIYENMEQQYAHMIAVFKQNILTKYMLCEEKRAFEPTVEHSSALNTQALAVQGTRSAHKTTQKYTTISPTEYKENNTTFDYAPEQSTISVINSKSALTTPAMEECSTSCCSAGYVNEVQSDRCGYLIVGDCIPPTRAPIHENQQQSVYEVKKIQNEKTKTKQTTIKVKTKTEIVDAYERSEKEAQTHIQISNNLHNRGDHIYDRNETNGVREFNSIEQVAAFNEIPHTWNLACLRNNLLISCSLNKITLYKYSNRMQYIDWFQDWLLSHYNPWSFQAKRALKLLGTNQNSYVITCKIWALLHESVQRRHCRRIWKYDKQGERVCLGEILNAHIFIKYQRVTVQDEVVWNKRKQAKLNVVISNKTTTNKQMKTNDEVILRPKSKDTLERGTKAQGKFLEHAEDVDALDEQQTKLNEDTNVESLAIIKDANNENNNIVLATNSATEQPNITSHKTQCTQPLVKEKEEDIYQPIWEFQTVGQVAQDYDSEPETYGACSRNTRNKCFMEEKSLIADASSSIPSLIFDDNVEDHGAWETADEFMFTKKFTSGETLATHKSSSTITSFDNSTIELGTSTASSLQDPLFRTVCIYYSLNEPKIRAIVYDYNRDNAQQYFSRKTHSVSLNKSIDPTDSLLNSSMSSPATRHKNLASSSSDLLKSESGNVSSHFNLKPVHAWKLSLLNPTHAEDEEDLIVSESEILRSQLFKEESESIISDPPKTATLQRFKSASCDNLSDIPREDDKKSITERMRNKLQRGVFKLNMRSPKSEKKGGIFRSFKTGSLYLEEGMQPKFPIFGAPLEQLEMNDSLHQQVPRFVADCVAYIERQECILQDGLYRASGNKLAIDELKQKLSESYIYDSKLLVADDIHTVTSLLKQFFRELATPLIPQNVYDRISRGSLDSAGITLLRDVLEEITDPNRATLKFLIRHLKNVAAFSANNRMPASNLAIVWGPCIFSANQLPFVDIGRMNTLTKLLIENYDFIFRENERLVN